MRHRTEMGRVVGSIGAVMTIIALSTAVSGQAQKPKRFLTGPLTIEDQGSFFVGGVPKITDHAVRPATGPGTTPPTQPSCRARNKSPSARCTCSSRSRQRRTGLAGRSSWCTDPRTPAPAWNRRRMAVRGGIPYFVRKGVSTYVVDQSGRGRSGFDQSVLHEAESRIDERRRQGRGGADPHLRQDHRQRRMDRVVRSSRAGRTRRFSPAG